ncbi:unnamed protein product [Thlaspi arvense]|uniref:Myb-like domain-containing protein n=1 Tax=Thlaspi arvense TaxID=13288 RepID=A0AAU9S5R4_THLAR|nr:unnamed protein product [Thlaspi arvense]
MANHSWTNEERKHHNTHFDNSTTAPERPLMKHQTGIAMEWTSEEQEILEDGLASYSSEPSISRYEKIASKLERKTIRDVAMRYKWIYVKSSSPFPSSSSYEIIDMVVASNSAPHLLAPSPSLSEEDVITYELLKQNEQFLSLISVNLTSSRLTENSTLFYKSRENINKLTEILNENAPDPIKHMPMPEEVNDDLLNLILTLSNLP